MLASADNLRNVYLTYQEVIQEIPLSQSCQANLN